MRQRLVSGAVGQSSITVVIALLILVFSASGSEPSALVYAYDQGPAPIALARDIAQIDAADLLVRPFTNSPDRATATYDGLRDFARASARPAGYGSAPSAIGGGLQFADDGARGFGSMSSFRRAYGSAGSGNQWHHVVEQTPGNVGRFGAETIHNTSNIVRLETGVHRQISGYYSSIQPFTGGQTVRRWLSTQPLDAQRQFGLEVLQRFGAAG